MPVTRRKNPLKGDALTADSAREGNRIICWTPGDPQTRTEYTLASDVYSDDVEGGTLVVEVITNDGTMRVMTADSVGLTGNRYTGEWSVIAILDEEVDD